MTHNPTTAEPVFLSAGDTALVVQFGEVVDREVNRRVARLEAAVRSQDLAGIVDLVPTFRSLMIHYDPLVTGQEDLCSAVTELLRHTPDVEGHRRFWRIPVCYEGDQAPDMTQVSAEMGMSPAEVIEGHAATVFDVFMMGFLPGFPYLGILPEAFDLPRRREPRVKVPARSISVAGRQTTVYTLECPGGWHLIGRTPVDFYDGDREDPILVAAGDQIQFTPISEPEYHETRRAVEQRTYEIDQAVIDE